MSKKRAFIFPGQGAQKVGMAKDFVDHFAVAKETFQEADDILSRGLSKIVFEGPSDELMRTDNCQVAIYVASVAMLRVVQRQFPELKPSFCAGLSLGEYTALTAAGKLEFGHCLPLVQARAQFMHEACASHPGTMLVVMGKTPDEVQELLDEMGPTRKVWIANLNCPGQVVLAATKGGAAAAQEFFSSKGVKRLLPLDVAGGFHSPLMEAARERLVPLIREAPLKESDCGLMMNATGGSPRALDEMRALMIEQVIAPVYWEKGVRALDGEGVEAFIEIGPGKTLSGMNRRIGVSGETYSIEKIEDLEKLGEAIHESALKE